jgi:hypothetical protein
MANGLKVSAHLIYRLFGEGETKKIKLIKMMKKWRRVTCDAVI